MLARALSGSVGLSLGRSLAGFRGGAAAPIAPFSADFTTGTYTKEGASSTFASMFSFSGTTNRYYMSGSGIWTLATSGVARTSHHRYDAGTSSYIQTLLLESTAAQNLTVYSEEFTRASEWAAVASTITANQSNGPGGTNTMDLVAETTATDLHGVKHAGANVISMTAGQEYNTSAYVKARGATRYIQIVYSTAVMSASNYVTFDLLTGTIANQVDGEATIEQVSADVFRISFTSTVTSTNPFGVVNFLSSNSASGRGPVFAGNTSNGFFIWGAQMELSKIPTSYVPTVGFRVTRSGEALTVANANLPYNATGMSFATKSRVTYIDDGTNTSVNGGNGNIVLYLLDQNTSNYLEGVIATPSADDGLYFKQRQAGVSSSSQVLYSGGTSGKIRLLRDINIAGSHGVTEIQGALDGVATTPAGSAVAFPTGVSASNLRVGFKFFGEMDEFRIWPEALTEAALAEVTA